MPGGEDCDVEKRCLLLMWSSGGGGAWDGELLSLDPLGSVSPHAPSSLCHGAQPTNETSRATAALRKVQHSHSLNGERGLRVLCVNLTLAI